MRSDSYASALEDIFSGIVFSEMLELGSFCLKLIIGRLSLSDSLSGSVGISCAVFSFCLAILLNSKLIFY